MCYVHIAVPMWSFIFFLYHLFLYRVVRGLGPNRGSSGYKAGNTLDVMQSTHIHNANYTLWIIGNAIATTMYVFVPLWCRQCSSYCTKHITALSRIKKAIYFTFHIFIYSSSVSCLFCITAFAVRWSFPFWPTKDLLEKHKISRGMVSYNLQKTDLTQNSQVLVESILQQLFDLTLTCK